MENKDFVSFEIAKLLKEKGFDVLPPNIIKTDYVWGYSFDLEDKEDTLKLTEFQWEDHQCSHLFLRPLHYQVQNWLLEKHGI